MLVYDSNDREVEISVYGKYSDDIQIDLAEYTDDGSEVPEDEIEYIQETFADDIYESWFESRMGVAEAYWEGDR